MPGEFIMNSVPHSCRKESKAQGKKKKKGKHCLGVSVEDDEHHILNRAEKVMNKLVFVWNGTA